MSTREELARQAERSLRLGRVDEAIAHYQELAYLAPVDWGLVKQLADLLERTGQREGAARQFARWADYLFAEGFHSKAAALYKKVLKLEDNDEHALWQLGEVSLELKLRADARVAFQRVADLRLRRGDASGAGAARQRLATLDAIPTVPIATPATPPAYAHARSSILSPVVDAVPTPLPEPGPELPSEPLAAPHSPTAIEPPETFETRVARLRREAHDADAAGATDADARWRAVLDADPTAASVRLRLVRAAIDKGDLELASRLAEPLDTEGQGRLSIAMHLQWVEICVDGNLPELSRAQRALARAYLAEYRLAEARAIAEAVFVREAGTEPARTLLLDVLGRQGVGDPHRALADLLTPTSDTTADDDSNVDEAAMDLAWMPEGNTAPPTPDQEAAPDPSVPDPLAEEPERSENETEAGAGSIFDWSNLLGRDVDHWGVPLVAASAAVLPEPAVPLQVVSDCAPVVVAAPPQMAEPEPLPIGVPDSVEDVPDSVEDVPDSVDASAPEAVVIVQAEELPAPLDVEATVVDAPSAIEAPTVVDPSHDAADALPPTAPRDTFTFADGGTRIGELRAQPIVAADAPLQPSFSMPRGWLTETSQAASDDTPRRRPEDDFLFDDDATPARWAPRALRSPVQAPPEAPASQLPTNVEPQPDDAPGSEVVAPAALEIVDGFREAAATVEEEVDLTQLLEELKQWDPVLPEPSARVRTASTDMPLAGLPLAFPERSTTDAAAIADAMIEPTTVTDAVPHGEALPHAPIAPGVGNAELDAVFADMQHRTDDRAVAEQQLAAGRVFLAAGLASEAARAFERASVEPRARFAGSLALAELHRSRGQLREAISWYEQAATAPVPDAAVKRAVLYDLAESLEALGETDRALGVLLDLLSQVEDYRDARARLDRLLRVDAGG